MKSQKRRRSLPRRNLRKSARLDHQGLWIIFVHDGSFHIQTIDFMLILKFTLNRTSIFLLMIYLSYLYHNVEGIQQHHDINMIMYISWYCWIPSTNHSVVKKNICEQPVVYMVSIYWKCFFFIICFGFSYNPAPVHHLNLSRNQRRSRKSRKENQRRLKVAVATQMMIRSRGMIRLNRSVLPRFFIECRFDSLLQLFSTKLVL